MGTSPQVPVPVLPSLDSLLLNISVTRKVRMCSSSLTTSSDSPRLVQKYLPFSAVSPLLWVTSQPLPPTWVACRSVSPPPRRDPSPPCRPSTCPLTTRQILPLPPHSLTWTPPLSCPDLLLNVESTPLWIPLTPPAVSWTLTLLDTSTTILPEEDKLKVARARKIERFLSQPFQVAEVFTSNPGKLVPISETISGFQEILAGKYDHLPEVAF